MFKHILIWTFSTHETHPCEHRDWTADAAAYPANAKDRMAASRTLLSAYWLQCWYYSTTHSILFLEAFFSYLTFLFHKAPRLHSLFSPPCRSALLSSFPHSPSTLFFRFSLLFLFSHTYCLISFFLATRSLSRQTTHSTFLFFFLLTTTRAKEELLWIIWETLVDFVESFSSFRTQSSSHLFPLYKTTTTMDRRRPLAVHSRFPIYLHLLLWHTYTPVQDLSGAFSRQMNRTQ